jgi:RecJ-like exonuclease
MPSGVERFVDHPAYARELDAACELLLTHRARWRVIYHYDGDGIASASCALRALERLAYPAQATPLFGVESTRLDGLLTATSGPVLLVDTGSSWLDRVKRHPHPVIVLDHHLYPGTPHPPELPSHVAFVNPLDWEVDGMTELCAASLTWLFTIQLDPRNWDNAPWGLSGVIADRQHQGGVKGLNARLVEEASRRSLVTRRPGLPLFGPSVREAVRESVDPYLVGISGRGEAVDRWLHLLSIDGGKNPQSLLPAEAEKLQRALADQLQAQGTRPEFIEQLAVPRFLLPALGRDAEELSNLQNACGRAGIPAAGLGMAVGDVRSWDQAESAERSWREGLLNGLQRVEEGALQRGASIQWFDTPDGPLAGTQAGLALTYFLDPTRPVFAFSPDRDRLRVSGRGTMWLVGQGLDLSEVCRTAAEVAGGEGGGHKVASGATIPGGAQTTFLEEADRRVALQLSHLDAGRAR